MQAIRPLPVSLIVSGSVHLGLMLLLVLTAQEVRRELITVDFIELPTMPASASSPTAPTPALVAPPRAEISAKKDPATAPLSEPSAEVSESVSTSVSFERQLSAKQKYQSQLMRELNSKKSYPTLAKKLKQEGLVVVQFRIARSGQVLDARVVKESPFKALNQSAKKLVESIKGLAPLPREITETTWLFEVPVQYQM